MSRDAAILLRLLLFFPVLFCACRSVPTLEHSSVDELLWFSLEAASPIFDEFSRPSRLPEPQAVVPAAEPSTLAISPILYKKSTDEFSVTLVAEPPEPIVLVVWSEPAVTLTEKTLSETPEESRWVERPVVAPSRAIQREIRRESALAQKKPVPQPAPVVETVPNRIEPRTATQVTIEKERAPAVALPAVTGQELAVDLDGDGWIYLGPVGDRDGVTYRSRERGPKTTTFTLIPEKPGEIEVLFQRQNNKTGKLVTQSVLLSVPAQAEPLLENSVTEMPEPTVHMADLPSLITATIAASDAATLVFLSEEYLDSQEIDTDILFSIGGVLFEEGLVVPAANVYEAYLKRGGRPTDQVYFDLGFLYESDSSIRDEKKAYKYYSLLVDRFPISLLWDKAQRRALYLRRHFLDLQ